MLGKTQTPVTLTSSPPLLGPAVPTPNQQDSYLGLDPAPTPTPHSPLQFLQPTSLFRLRTYSYPDRATTYGSQPLATPPSNRLQGLLYKSQGSSLFNNSPGCREIASHILANSAPSPATVTAKAGRQRCSELSQRSRIYVGLMDMLMGLKKSQQ